ncbi:MAG: PLP-dependent aspartate aminotransferase family protein [bacterium]
METAVIHLKEKAYFDNPEGDIVKPIHLTTTYYIKQIEQENQTDRLYQRYDNQTREAVEEKLAYIEKTKYCLAFASGMAAISTVLFSTTKPNDQITAFDDLYSVTKKVFNSILPAYNIKVNYVDLTRIDSETIKTLAVSSKVLWLESPTNPLMKTINVQKIVEEFKSANPQIIVVFDNTFLTPYFYNPVEDGVDIVVHSATKYLNGHSDCLAGAVMLNDQSLYEQIKFYRDTLGNPLPPFESYLLLRGLKTLHVRMEKHQQNCLKLIEYLKTKDFVQKILYPSLYGNLSKNVRGYGGTLSFLVSFSTDQIQKFLSSLKIINHAVSLGGVESLICVPYYSTHKDIPNIPPNLIRLSVGIENVEDIIQDLEQAFSKVT